MTLLVLALALVGYGWWRLETAPGRTEARARDDVTRVAAATRTRLSAAAAGGSLLETELDRAFRKGPDSWAEERDGRHVTVTALLTGSTGVWMGTVTADGCYEFTVTCGRRTTPGPRARSPGRAVRAAAPAPGAGTGRRRPGPGRRTARDGAEGNGSTTPRAGRS